MNILIVDNRPPNLKLLRFILESEGHAVCEATDGVEALAILNRDDVDVIISDILMPRMDGYRLCQEVRKSERLREIPFIFYTATYTSPGDEKLCLELGGDKYMQKPATPEALAAAVQEVIQNGEKRARRGAKPPDEDEVMKEYNARLVFKLEEKIAELLLQTTAMENAANAIVITDSKGHILRVNPAFTTLSGYAAEEVIGHTPRVLKSGQHDQGFYHDLWRTILGGQTWRGEFINRRKDGSLYHGEQTITPFRAQGGPITHFIGIMNDVTERKRAEAEFRLFRTLVDQSSDTFEVIDPETGRFLDVNEKGPAELGCSRAEYLAQRVCDIDPMIEESAWPELAKKICASGSWTGEGCHRRKDGTTFPIEFNAKWVHLDRDYIVTVTRDITERKRTEGALRKSEQRLREVVENIREVFWMSELDLSRIIYVSPGYEVIWGRTCESLKASPHEWAEAIHPDDRERAFRACATNAPLGTYDEEYRITRPDGTVRWIHDRGFPVKDENGKVYRLAGVAADITERKKLEAQFLRAQRMENIGTLAGGIAHDLNNVLGPIVMSLDLLAMKFPDADSAEMLDILRTSAQRGVDMVRQVLSFARGVEGRRMELQVAHLVRDIEKIANDTFLKYIQMRTNLPRDLWTVTGDPTQLHQVLLNLCVNARDAMPNGGTLTFSAENLQLDAQYAGLNPEAKPGSYVVLQVEDNGTGIPPAILEKIFDPFFTTKEIGKGTGLGLSTTLAIVKSHGGFIRVYSELGKGTTFKIYLPAQTEASAEVAPESAPELPRGNGELILVADDEVSVRLITQQTLEAFGYRVVLAADGAEAVAIYATRGAEIAVVLTDMMMPVMDGPATIQVLRKINPKVHIIAASGLSANGRVTSAPDLGIKHFLPKPFTAETLLKVLKELLSST